MELQRGGHIICLRHPKFVGKLPDHFDKMFLLTHKVLLRLCIFSNRTCAGSVQLVSIRALKQVRHSVNLSGSPVNMNGSGTGSLVIARDSFNAWTSETSPSFGSTFLSEWETGSLWGVLLHLPSEKGGADMFKGTWVHGALLCCIGS